MKKIELGLLKKKNNKKEKLNEKKKRIKMAYVLYLK
jgi:hypothetical protein